MKLFVILPRFPYPTEKGDKLRAFHQLRVLSKQHEISLFALSHKNVKESDVENIKSFCNSITIYRLRLIPVAWNLCMSLFNGRPFQAGYYYSKNAHKLIHKKIEEIKPDHVFCQLLRTAAYTFDCNINKTLDYQDVFSKGIERRIPSANWFVKLFLKLELKRLRKYEYYVFDKFDNKTIITKPDRDQIPHPEKDKIVIIPNGVDQEYFKPFRKELISELLFTGNMGYPPNIDCAEYLVNKVLPIIHQKYPEARLTIAGASPHSRVKALASDKVFITGWVDDIRDYYAGARIFMAPMQLGTGLQNKLLEAMAMKLPCVTSSLCNSALLAADNNEILVGNTPSEVAQQAIRLLDNPEFASTIAYNGFTFVTSKYSWEGATQKLSDLMEKTPAKNGSL